MRELINVLFDEDKSFDFPWWVYAFVMPIALIVLCLLAGVKM